MALETEYKDGPQRDYSTTKQGEDQIFSRMKDVGMSRMESHGNGHADPAHAAGTQRRIKSRHAQMIAIGGAIGTGLFVGSGEAPAVAGPAFLLLAYIIMSLLAYGVMTAVIEVGAFLPVPGCSMPWNCSRYVSKSLGFAMGWLYFYTFAIIVAYEITAAAIVINYWPNSIPIAAWITIMLVVVIGINLCPVNVYAEMEFWFSRIKVVMIVGLQILSVVLMCGGGPSHETLGFKYWIDPGATKTYLIGSTEGRFAAFLWVWVYSGFSFFYGLELIVYKASEMENPRKNLPIASRRYWARLVIFYVVSVIFIGAICNSNSQGLTSGSTNANASPWVIAIQNAGINILPSIINAGILSSAWSSGNAYLYMSSRTLYSLAIAGDAPKIFTRCTKAGLPIYAVVASSCLALLAYMNCGTQSGVVFNWFVNLNNTSGYTAWILCCIIHLRFRKARQVQGVDSPFSSKLHPWTTWICLFLLSIQLPCNGFTVFYPGQFTASGFLTAYIGVAIFTALWIGHQLTLGRKEPWLRKPEDIDLVSGLREVETDAETWNRM